MLSSLRSTQGLLTIDRVPQWEIFGNFFLGKTALSPLILAGTQIFLITFNIFVKCEPGVSFLVLGTKLRVLSIYQTRYFSKMDPNPRKRTSTAKA